MPGEATQVDGGCELSLKAVCLPLVYVFMAYLAVNK